MGKVSYHKCDCGNEMAIGDKISVELRESQIAIITCDQCGRKHKFQYNGSMFIERGAKIKARSV